MVTIDTIVEGDFNLAFFTVDCCKKMHWLICWCVRFTEEFSLLKDPYVL